MIPADTGSLVDAPERELVRRILKNSRLLHPFFDFVVSEALGHHRPGWQYFFAYEVEREWLGLPPGQPGDVDVLIVPEREGRLHLEFTAAVEVKRLAIRDGRIGRNVDRYGLTQAQGLLRDGFPYVGVLHIAVCEPGPMHAFEMMGRCRVIDGTTGEVEMLDSVAIDTTGLRAADKQFYRLLARDAESPIGLAAVGLQRAQIEGADGYHIFGSSQRPATRNQNVSRRLLAMVGSLIEDLRSTAVSRD